MNFWYARKSLLGILLYPLSIIYRIILFLRRFCYRVGIFRVHYFPVPIIVVGNLTVGGTGKTPCVRALCQLLMDQGMKPGVVMRGYGGKSCCYPLLVSDDSHYREVGDEALMLSKGGHFPVVVSPSRVDAVRYLLEHADCDVIISDDGLQHFSMDRDIEIVVVDGQRGLGNGFCLPAGPLREPICRLKTCDCLLINSGPKDLLETTTKVFTAEVIPVEFVSLLNKNCCDRIKVNSCYAIAGIGNPNRFFRLLQSMGYDCETRPLKDHANLDRDTINFPDADAIVMTEKDAIKCQAFADQRHWYLSIRLGLSEDFCDFIISRLQLVQ